MYSKTAILVISLLVLAVLFFFLGIDATIFASDALPLDSFDYFEASDFLYIDFKAHFYRPLLYAFLLGLPNIINETVSVSQYISFGVFLNFIAWFVTVMVLHKTLRLILGPKSSFWTTLAFVFSIGSTVMVFYVLTEILSILLLVLFAYNLVKYSKDENIKHFAYGLASMNFLTLIRPGFYYIAILFSLIIIVFALKRGEITKLIRPIYILSCALVILQLFAINSEYGDMKLSYIDKYTWYLYLGSESKAQEEGLNYKELRDKRRAEVDSITWHEVNAVATADLKLQLKENSDNVLREYYKNIIENIEGGSAAILASSKASEEGIKKKIIVYMWLVSKYQNILYILSFLLSLILFLVYFKSIHWSIYSLYMISGYVILTSGISFWQGDRFHIVIYPMIMLGLLLIASKISFLKKLLSK